MPIAPTLSPPSRWSLPLGVALALLLAGCGSSGGGGSGSTACGNGRLDSGEQCDDGNTVDTDACTAQCRDARCGDGAIRAGVEMCDGTNLGVPAAVPRCFDLGYAAGAGNRQLPACTADCASFDPAPCGAQLTPTPIRPTATVTRTHTPSPTPTPTETPRTTTCGDHLLEDGETCTTCPDDCVAAACAPSGANATFAVTVAGARVPQTASVQLAYRTDALSIPGSGNDITVRQRVRAAPPIPSAFMVNDLDYAVDIQAIRTAGLGSPFATARFDTCAAAPAATVDDLSCVVLACSDGTGAIANCRCTVAAQP